MTPSSRLKILVVEDDEPKLSAIERLLSHNFSDTHVVVAKSMTSAICELAKQEYDLVILDMSLPTYDFSKDKAGGGRPQGFGGEELLRYIESEMPRTHCVVVTQYEEFTDSKTGGKKSLKELEEDLRARFPTQLLGVTYYEGQQGEWSEFVSDAIRDLAKQLT